MAPAPSDWPSPAIANLHDGETVYNRLLLIHGRAGPPNVIFEGTIHVDTFSSDSPEPFFPPQTFPVVDSHFKALVPVHPNAKTTIRILFEAPSSWNTSSHSDQGTSVTVQYKPLKDNAPLHLVILAARDSPLTVDCPPNKRGQHDTISAVVAKMQLWAYLSQAFTAEDSRRNGFGRRTFALHEASDAPDSLESFPPRSRRTAPVVHVLRSSHSLAEFRDPNNTQQNKHATRQGAMHEFATEALNHPSSPLMFHSPHGAYVAVLTLDSHWDSSAKLLLAHAALGAGGPVGQGNKIGAFGSHSCWSWPRSLEEVVPAMMDASDVDERYVVNDLGNIGTLWETLNVGHGAFLHECGHALNLPHHRTGIMARGYHEWNRSFCVSESLSKRTATSSCRCITTEMDHKENHWDRMSLIRLRYHPTMRLPSDPLIPYIYTRQAPSFALTNDGISIHGPVGLGSIEIQVDDRYVNHVEFPFMTEKDRPPPQDMHFTNAEIGELAGADMTTKKVTITAIGTDQRHAEIENYGEMCRTSRLVIKIGPEGPAPPVPTSSASTSTSAARGNRFKNAIDKFEHFINKDNKDSHQGIPSSNFGPGPGEIEVIKGIAVGFEKRENAWMIILNSSKPPFPRLVKVDIISGLCLDGLRLFWSDGSKQNIGPCAGGHATTFKVSPPSKVLKLNVRSGAWLDAASVCWEGGETGLCGGAGGDLRSLVPPPGMEICGFYGSSGQWMNSLGLLYTASKR